MAEYIDKLVNTINKRQARQVLNLLNKKRNVGQIRSVEEFSSQLESLVRELTTTTLTPSLKLWLGQPGEVIDSETYNFMLERVEDDLVAAFEQGNNLEEVQAAHEAIVRDVLLKNLRSGIAELESKVDLYEFVNRDTRGFDATLFSTFRESKKTRLFRGDIESEFLFRDPRRSETISSTQDAVEESVGERLILGSSKSTQHSIYSARQIFDSEAIQSELLTELPGTKLSNIVDNTSGTYWVQSLLFSQKRQSVKIKLELAFGSSREINYIDIEPVGKYGFTVEDIHFVDGNNIVTDLDITEQEIKASTSIRLRKVSTNRLILTLRNENAKYREFEYSDLVSLAAQAIEQEPLVPAPSAAGVSQQLNAVIGSLKIQEILGLFTTTDNQFIGYEFITGIDNIRVGLVEHLDRSIYSSIALSIPKSAEIGIRTVESRPYLERSSGKIRFTNTTYDISTDSSLTDDDTLSVGEQSYTWFQNSIEYWIVQTDLTAGDRLTRTITYPILPLNTSRIHHERLVLNEKSADSEPDNDIGQTVFYTNRTDGDIKVYRNGVLLVDASDDTNPTYGWEDITEAGDKRPNSGSAMRFRIQVHDRFPGDVFTISYTPVLSSTRAVPRTISDFDQIGGLKVVDLVGDLSVRVGPEQIIDSTAQTERSNIYLVIILRRNTARSDLTSAVEEYTLLAGKKDTTKFIGL